MKSTDDQIRNLIERTELAQNYLEHVDDQPDPEVEALEAALGKFGPEADAEPSRYIAPGVPVFDDSDPDAMKRRKRYEASARLADAETDLHLLAGTFGCDEEAKPIREAADSVSQAKRAIRRSALRSGKRKRKAAVTVEVAIMMVALLPGFMMGFQCGWGLWKKTRCEAIAQRAALYSEANPEQSPGTVQNLFDPSDLDLIVNDYEAVATADAKLFYPMTVTSVVPIVKAAP